MYIKNKSESMQNPRDDCVSMWYHSSLEAQLSHQSLCLTPRILVISARVADRIVILLRVKIWCLWCAATHNLNFPRIHGTTPSHFVMLQCASAGGFLGLQSLSSFSAPRNLVHVPCHHRLFRDHLHHDRDRLRGHHPFHHGHHHRPPSLPYS